jgi:protease-4
MLKEYKQKTGKPVVAYFQNVAASGGYYISAACDEIIAHPTTITGSIGVIMTFIQAEDLMNKIGVKSNIIVSEKTPYKDIGSPFRKMKDTERAMLQKMVEEIYNRFVDIVTEGRRSLNREEVLELATGMIYSGTEALNRKLVDRVGSFEDAVQTVRKRAGSPDAKVVELRSRPGFIQSLLSSKSREVNLGLFSFSRFREYYNGQPLYLWLPGREEKASE